MRSRPTCSAQPKIILAYWVCFWLGLFLISFPSARCQSLSGIHIGDARSTAAAIIGFPPDKSDRSGPFAYNMWVLGDYNELHITARVTDGKIVYIESDWGGKSASTDFPGFVFGKTTRSQIFERFGSHGMIFPNRMIGWQLGDAYVFSDSWEVNVTPPVIVTLMTGVTDDRMRLLVSRGEKYFNTHIDDAAVLRAIMLGDPAYIRSIWTEASTSSPGYRELPLRMFQPLDMASAERSPSSPAHEIKLVNRNGILLVPVQVNDRLILDFIIDSGASEVQIPDDVFRTLLRTGTVSQGDFLDTETYILADGSKVPSARYLLRKLQVGGYVIQNVVAGIGGVHSEPLLGQSFLSKFGSWSLDNNRGTLTLSEKK